jgi:hypothetical protein
MFREINWSEHASDRLEEWGLDPYDVERGVRRHNRRRQPNPGDGDWRLKVSVGERGYEIVVIYDHPVDGDDWWARIVTVWPR